MSPVESSAAMKWILLFDILALLLLLPCAETKSTAPTPLPLKKTDGPKCAQWLYGTEPPQVEAFQCAEQPDGAEVKFCCGTCGQALSCSFQELAEGSAEGPIDGSAEPPTDGRPEPCPISLPFQYWVRILWYCGGILTTVVVYCVFPQTWEIYCGRKINSRERQEEIEMQVPASARLRSSPDCSTRLAQPSSADLPSPSNCPALESSNLPLLEPHPDSSEYVTVMWFPTVPPKNGTNSASKPKQDGSSSPATPSNQELPR